MTRTRGEYGSLVVLLALIACAVTIAVSSCGGGGGGSSGGLCAQCGDTDGPCQNPFTLSADDTRTRPSGCPATGDCTFGLTCLRKLDSAQRRCFPLDQNGNLDILYRCDGARPNPNTATPAPTSTPGPTSTAAGDGTQTVSIEVDTGTVLSVFSVIVGYPNAKGSFTPPGGGSPQCTSDDDVSPDSRVDTGNSLQLSFPPADELGTDFFTIECTFYLSGADELEDGDLTPAGTPAPGISVDVSF